MITVQNEGDIDFLSHDPWKKKKANEARQAANQKWAYLTHKTFTV